MPKNKKKKAPTPPKTQLKTPGPVKARFRDEHYMNWQKACHILLTGKTTIDRYVKKIIPLLHEDIRTSIEKTKSCVTCKSGDVNKIRDKENVNWEINCSAGICQAWVNEITQRHAHNDNIYWKNSNICSWPSNEWELAKVFMGRLVISKQQSNVEKQSKVETAAASLESQALNPYDKSGENEDIMPSVPPESIDISHVLSVLTNCKYFHEDTKGKAEKGAFQNPIREEGLISIKNVARIRNELYHNAVLKIKKSDIDRCKVAMDTLLRKLRIYNTFYEHEVKELVELDPVYMDRDHYDKFVRLEALTVAALLDDQENQEQESTENLDNVLKLLESEDNVDLRASVSMIRNIPISAGLGDGANTNNEPQEDPEEPIEPPDTSLIPELEIKPEFNNSRSVTLQLPWEVLYRNGVTNQWKPVLVRETNKHDEITVEPGNVITDHDIKTDTSFRYRLMIPNQTPDQGIKYGPWKDLDMSQSALDIRRTTNYLQWQALGRIVLHSAFTVTRKITTQLCMMIREPQTYNTRNTQSAIQTLHKQKTELYTTRMLMVDDDYWRYIIDSGSIKDSNNLQTKYNYVVYGDGPETMCDLTIPALSKLSLLFKFKYVTETLFLADFLCHISREMDNSNDVLARRENINALFWMFRNNPNLQRDVDLQLRDSICVNGIIDLRAVSTVKEIEDKWRTHVNKQRASVSTETSLSVSP